MLMSFLLWMFAFHPVHLSIAELKPQQKEMVERKLYSRYARVTVPVDLKLWEACRLVENVARSIGKDCRIIFTDTAVSVAPLSWAGDSTGKILYDALKEARKHADL